MKRCPTCDRTYADDSTTFCLADGSLLSAPYDPGRQAPYDSDATQRIPARLTNPPPTEVLPTNPSPAPVWPSYQSYAPPIRRSNTSTYVIIAAVVLLVGVGIFVAVKVGQKSTTPSSGGVTLNANANANTNTNIKIETPAATDYLRTPWLSLEVWQGGKANGLMKVDVRRTKVAMSREPFEIRVPRLANNPPVLITAWKSDDIFSQLKDGDKLDEESSSYFNPYKSMADTSAGSATLMLDNDAHSFFDADRMKSISDSQSTIFFSSILDGEERSVKDQSQDLYLVVFRDLNKNGVADNGEFEFLVLDF
jgi:hypothetical protein